MENQENKLTIRTLWMVVVFPGKFIEESTGNLNQTASMIIWILAVSGGMLTKGLTESSVSPLAALYWPIMFLMMMAVYFPSVYGYSFLLWQLGKGFGGQASFDQMRKTVVLSLLPLIINFPFTIIYTWMAVSRNDLSLASRQITIVDWIIWLVGFRILATGIARFNRFNKTQTIIVWFLIALALSAIQGLIYWMRH
ncbi:MAG: YIP1 family protein [Prolixibacteraceae bacterium]|nr:YIP1 family protein [Prolixibacteraceae bacterium]